MNHSSQTRNLKTVLLTLVTLSILFIFTPVLSIYGQGSTNGYSINGGIPSGLAPGVSAGSYPLSGFDNINYATGSLNFVLPLHSITGRGDAEINLVLQIERHWSAKSEHDYWYCPTGNNNCYERFRLYPDYSMGLAPRSYLDAGRMYGRKAGKNTVACQPYSQGFEQTITRLYFVTADGSEITFRDTASDGATFNSNSCNGGEGPSRGTAWKSDGNSKMTFVSDIAINDAFYSVEAFPVTGNLYFPNGLRYRIVDGIVTEIVDRQGNKTTDGTITENGQSVRAITDSNGRQVTFQDGIKFKGTNGATRQIRFGNNAQSLRTDYTGQTWTYGQLFPDYNGSAGWSFAAPPSGPGYVELPDGRRYNFYYNPYGELARVELPTGAAIEYDWASGFDPTQLVGGSLGNTETGFGYVYRRVVERREYSNGGSGSSYSAKITIRRGFDAPNATVRFYGPGDVLLSRTEHYYYGLAWQSLAYADPLVPNSWASNLEYRTESYDAAGNLSRVVEQTWQSQRMGWGGQYAVDPILVETKTTLADTNQVSKVAYGYQAGVPYTNQTDVYEYDYGTGAPGGLLRHTHTDFVTDTNYTSETGAYLRSLPSQTWVSPDANGTTKASLTQFEYDNYNQAPNQPDTNHAALEPRTGYTIVGHDTANYGAGKYIRGNVTKVTTYGNAQAQSGAISVYSQYDILGNVVKTKDANGNASTIGYGDNFGTPDSNATTNTPPSQLNGQSTFAFPTSLTNPPPFNWTTYSQYDYFTGAPVNTQDINGVISKTFYNDPLDRPTQTVTAVGLVGYERQSNVIYDDANKRIETKSDLNALNDNLLKSESFYDGLGRTIEGREYESDGGYVATRSIPFVMVQDPDTAVWRAATKGSNPYRPLNGEQPVWTTSLADELGRPSKVITTDGAIVRTSYSGNATTVTDQAGKKRRSITNSTGQLVRVDEPNSSGQLDVNNVPYQPTNYNYDILNNLLAVTQNGSGTEQCGPSGGNCTQTRTFVYDSLSRLKSANNPESGLIQYVYDNNGNLAQKTDARLVVANYVYDELNRITQRNYTAPTALQNYQASPNVTYTYGTAAPKIGKLTKVESGVSTTEYTSFDILGRVTGSKQTTDGVTYGAGGTITDPSKDNAMTYAYNLSGALIEQQYPSGRKVKNTLDASGDLEMVTSRKNANAGYWAYANNFTYNAAGAVISMQLGNGTWESTAFNSILQPEQIALGTVQNGYDKLKLNYTYGSTANNNGNVLTQAITVPAVGTNPGFTATQNYTYDSLNRINDATEMLTPTGGTATQTWKQTFLYDRYGNRTFDTTQNRTTTIPNGCPMAVCNPSANTSDNKLKTVDGYQFDNAGNTKTDAENRTFIYDSENKQVEVKNASNQTIGKYWYDGDGKRVKKEVPLTGEVTIFVYDATGKLVAEYSTIVASTQDAKVAYLTNDHLGSPRINTDRDGAVTARHDYHPFGKEIATSQRTVGLNYSDDTVRKQFTGYERDSETGLDFAEARMYSSEQGRFDVPDPSQSSAKPENPQTFNRYSYVGNNPTLRIDISGKDWIVGYYSEKVNGQLVDVQRPFWVPKAEISPDIPRAPSVWEVNVGKVGFQALDPNSNRSSEVFATRDEAERWLDNSRIQSYIDAVGENAALQITDRVTNPDGVSAGFNLPVIGTGGQVTVTRDGDVIFAPNQSGNVLTDWDSNILKRENLLGGFNVHATVIPEALPDRESRLNFFTGPSGNFGGCLRVCGGVTAVPQADGSRPRIGVTFGFSPGATANAGGGFGPGFHVTNLRCRFFGPTSQNNCSQ